MKTLLTTCALLLSFSVGAAEPTSLDSSISSMPSNEGQITMKTESAKVDLTKYNSSEAGIGYSSIDNGTAFIQMALVHEFQNGFALGGRANLPMQYSRNQQIYSGQLLARFMIMNNVNKMYIEPALTQALLNGDYGNHTFLALGASYGFMREIKRDMILGARVGIDGSGTRVANGTFRESQTFYNSIALMGSYGF